MKISNVKKVCVVGGGLMGRQIAMNTAIYGYDVALMETDAKTTVDIKKWVEEYLGGRVAKGKLSENDAKQIKKRLVVTRDLEMAAKDADIVIEAIIENLDIKTKLFKALDNIVRADTIIATNSSYMPSSLFKDVIKNPSRLANLHYFNPALVMKLTEVVSGEHTSESTVNILMEFSRCTNKDPVLVKKEIDGFIANRILRAVNFEAFSLLEKGVATMEDIDKAVEKGLNYPMGPFKLQDLTGIDLAYLAAQNLLEKTGFRRPGFEILKAKYESGEWGKKSGKGWYSYH